MSWAPGQIVKLFKAGVPQRVGWWEARMTRRLRRRRPGTRHRLDGLTTGLRDLMLYGCLTRLKQHPHAPDERNDACYPCNQTA